MPVPAERLRTWAGRLFRSDNTATRLGRAGRGATGWRAPFPSVDRLESRTLLSSVVISEFLAVNSRNRVDEDNEFSDWIELHNTTAAPVDLAGWHLTDDPDLPTKWTLPAVTLGPDGYLLVWASNKDRTATTPGAQLHTNFKLEGDGEYLALVEPDGSTLASEFDPYPPQESDVSYGLGAPSPVVLTAVPSTADARYFVPSPGAAPAQGWAGGNPSFNHSAWLAGQTGLGFEIGQTGPPALPEEQEPNDTAPTADDASANFVPADPAAGSQWQLGVKAQVGSNTDADFYTLGALDAGDVISVSESGSTSSGGSGRGSLSDSYVELWRSNGGTPTVVTFSDDHGPGFDSLIHRFRIPAADTYYVRAGSYGMGGSGTYDLGVYVQDAPGASTGPSPAPATPVTREVEPNNTPATATNLAGSWRPVQYRSVTSGTVSSGAALDYFAFQFTAGDLVTITVDSTSPLDASVALLSGSGGALASDAGDDGGVQPATDQLDARVLSFLPQTTGRYVVRVGSNGASTSGAYSLELQLSAASPPPAGAPYAGLIRTNVAEAMHAVSPSAFVRVPFTFDPDVLPGGVAALTLGMKYDDGFVAYLNGTEIARRNAPGNAGTPVAPDAAASAEHPDRESVRFENIDVTTFAGALVGGQNVLAFQALNLGAADDDFLLLPQLHASTAAVVPEPAYFVSPTPGRANGSNTLNQGPLISNVAHAPAQPADDQDLVVTAKVSPAPGASVAEVTLEYRAMYAAEQSLPMYDDGAHGDGGAGDGVYGGSVPAAATRPGQMIRYAVTTTDSLGRVSRAPVRAREESPQYFGTVVANPPADNSTLPVLHLFAQDVGAMATRPGTRGSVFYDGDFYDNVHIHDRGGFSSDGYKVDFNPGYHFRWSRDAGAGRVDEINVNYQSAYDETRLRAPLAFETYTNAGVPALSSFPVRVQRNGTLFRLATFVEDPDEEYLDRVGLDGRGALYKLDWDNPQMFNAGAFEKKTRRAEGYEDLDQFLGGIHQSGAEQVNYLFDHVDIPAFLNYWAANTIVNDNDNVQKNYLLYRDTFGDGEWQFLPWDKDLTFGKHWSIGDYAVRDPQAHPFFGDSNHPKIDGPQAYNFLIDALLDVPEVKQMYLRRLRTLMDELLQPATTPLAERKFERRLDEMFAQVSGDPQVLAQMASLRGSLNAIRDRYLQPRRNHLYVDHSTNTRYPDFAGIPAAQQGSPPVDIAEVDYNPASGDQGQEYVKLTNPNGVAVDLSGWTLGGGVTYALPVGLVVPAGGSVYVAKELRGFRARTTGPGGGQRLLAVGGYEGQLSARGETIVLSDAGGATVDTFTYAGEPTAAQRSIRVTEIMYHPADAPNNTPGDEQFEFIEIQNVSGEPVNLNGLKFTQGVNVFASNVTLAPGAYAVFVKNRPAFESRYGAAAANVVGTFGDDTLDNAGERLRLEDLTGEVVLDFSFDARDWYPSTDGLGRSLVIRDAGAPVATWGDAAAWRPSGVHNGTPGGPDSGADTTPPTFDLVDVTPDPRPGPADSVTLAFSEPVYGLDLSDLLMTLNGLPVALDAGATLAGADGGRTWTLGNLAALAGSGEYTLALRAAGSGIADYGANPLADDGGDSDGWRVDPPPSGTAVAGRWLFYNNSSFDGGTPGASDADLAAVAPDKALMPPGRGAAFANVSSYANGINGILIDFAGAPPAALGPDDFSFRSGTSADPASWNGAVPAPAVTRLASQPGAAGARYALTWPDRSIVNTWLEVAVAANARTGLAARDVFYVGSLVGEAGDPAPGVTARVSALDVAAVKQALSRAAGVGSPLDFNRDGKINALDLAAVKTNLSRTLPRLNWTQAAGAAAAPPPPGWPGVFGATPLKPLRVWEELQT